MTRYIILAGGHGSITYEEDWEYVGEVRSPQPESSVDLFRQKAIETLPAKLYEEKMELLTEADVIRVMAVGQEVTETL